MCDAFGTSITNFATSWARKSHLLLRSSQSSYSLPHRHRRLKNQVSQRGHKEQFIQNNSVNAHEHCTQAIHIRKGLPSAGSSSSSAKCRIGLKLALRPVLTMSKSSRTWSKGTRSEIVKLPGGVVYSEFLSKSVDFTSGTDERNNADLLQVMASPRLLATEMTLNACQRKKSESDEYLVAIILPVIRPDRPLALHSKESAHIENIDSENEGALTSTIISILTISSTIRRISHASKCLLLLASCQKVSDSVQTPDGRNPSLKMPLSLLLAVEGKCFIWMGRASISIQSVRSALSVDDIYSLAVDSCTATLRWTEIWMEIEGDKGGWTVKKYTDAKFTR
ncbi:hypothetical protein CPB84DRAFT_1828198 [Gymnopilus junonius]|uniref:Uncharacterized protein n=1 Tax=Gymnopilus junonius TaxID=109634 RepID=A0A9P5NBS4_GYMJU|nr:hypothetical protein CPB84DRAFT_1828198 [Gymnopilus junonius]